MNLSAFEHIILGFLFIRFSIVFESLAIIMPFDLNSSFRKFVSFLYQIKDSDNSCNESVLNVFSSV